MLALEVPAHLIFHADNKLLWIVGGAKSIKAHSIVLMNNAFKFIYILCKGIYTPKQHIQ